jgi:transcriptional regulator with XRE-family HTH domain
MNFRHWFDRFQEERKRLAHTMESFALVLGVSKSTVAHYEAGKTEPNRAGLESAAHVGADVLYIVTGQRLEEAVANGFDWELLLKIAQGVDAWANQMNLLIPVEKKIGLMKLLYKRFSVSKVVLDSEIEETVRLIA